MFFQCDCGQEAIHIERDLEFFEEEKRYVCLLNFSIYHFGIENHKPTLKEKLRHCWHIIRTGKNYSDQIILNQDTARQLGTSILDLVSEKSILEALKGGVTTNQFERGIHAVLSSSMSS